jgi:uncharacterized membrane protein YfcA
VIVLGFESTVIILTIALTFLLAGFVKGVIGMGLPTVAIGLLGVIMPPAQAAALLIVPSLVTNVWQLLTGPKLGALVQRLWSMMLAVCVGTWAGAGVLTSGSAKPAAFVLGVVLVVYAYIGLTTVRFCVPQYREVWLSPIVGIVTGVVTGATGVFVIPAVPYLQALGLDKEELVQAMGLSFTVSTLALGLSLVGGGALGTAGVGASMLALAPALAGMFVGQWVRIRISAETFRRVFFLGMLALGAYLALRTFP